MYLNERKARFCLVLGLAATAVGSNAASLWACNSNSPTVSDTITRFDSSDPVGSLTVVGSTGIVGQFMSGLDFAPNGTLYAVSTPSFGTSNLSSLYTIDQSNGHATLIGTTGVPSGRDISDITYNPATGKMMGVAFDGSNNYLYSLNLSTGAATLEGQINSPGSIFLGMSADSTGQMYLEDVLGTTMVKLNGLNVSAMPQPIGVSVIFSQGMTMDWSRDNSWYLATTWGVPPDASRFFGDVRLMNRTTGATQQILGSWPQNGSGTFPRWEPGDLAIAPVPEPASVIGVSLALAGLSARRKRRA